MSPSTPRSRSSIRIVLATTASDRATVAELFKSYVAWLDVDLSFQDFETELASLPGKYAESEGGALFLAKDSQTDAEGDDEDEQTGASNILGVIALRALPREQQHTQSCAQWDRRCEMKRLYVTPSGRGRGVGRALIGKFVEEAAVLGYDEIVLDTLPYMTEARALYKSLGFRECEPYYHNPLAGVIFLKRTLTGE